MRACFAAGIFTAIATAAGAVEVGDPEKGFDYAVENCADCHAIKSGEIESPNLAAPGFSEIADTPGISELALLSFFQTEHPTMPNLVVESSDARDLIAYILNLKK